MGQLKFDDRNVEAVFDAYPPPIRRKLLQIRSMIFDVAGKTPGVGAVQEALRWGQPSYLTPQTGSGSTIRIDRIRNDLRKYSVYFICTSGLIDHFKEIYPYDMLYAGNRSIVFDVDDRVPVEALRHCFSLALTFHLRKRAKKK